ncbi:MAG TPA: hypothetical protein VKK79_19335 [Candidatus Lokiarchaeia archaeon]|nr:hypothetical protein [Candidatus Lokiarchaeia archaeon]
MAVASIYLIGVLLSIGSGILNFYGNLIQKKVVNDVPPENRDEKFFRTIVKRPLWIWGLLCQLAFGSILFLFAVNFIGPTLPPGLMATGMIVLAIGSVRLLKESLHKVEIAGIIIMVVAILLLGLSDLEISSDVVSQELLDTNFIIRTVVFTAILLGLIIFCMLAQKRATRAKGIFLTIASGTYFGLSNFWTSPLTVTIDILVGVNFSWGKLIIFVVACCFLVLSNIFGTATLQMAYKYGNASLLVPIQQIPTQIAPIFYYFSVFLLWPPNPLMSIPLLFVGIGLILVSTFMLASRQVALDEIGKKEEEAFKAKVAGQEREV